MKHRPIFDISGIPPSKIEVDKVMAFSRKITPILGYSTIPVIVISGSVGLMLGKWFLVSYMKDSLGAAVPFGAALLGFLIFSGIFIAFGTWRKYWLNTANLLEPLTLAEAEKALALADKHPEIDAYRIAVAMDRVIRKGDFEAMMKFASDAEERNIARAIYAKRETAIIQLHHIP